MVGGPVEPRLRQHRVHADEHRERKREHIDGADREGEPARADRIDEHPSERDSEQDLLPGLDGGQRAPAHAGAVESCHDRVVGGEPDKPHVQRRDGASPDEKRCGDEQEPVRREREPRSHQATVKRAGARARPRLFAKRLDLATPRQHGVPSFFPKRPQNEGLMLPRGSAD